MHGTRIRSSSSLRKQRITKHRLLMAILVGMGLTAFHPCANADLFVSNGRPNSILRYDERTGDFLGEFITSGSGGLINPSGLIFGPDGNLYVSSVDTHSIHRFDGVSGAPLPSPGNTGSTF